MSIQVVALGILCMIFLVLWTEIKARLTEELLYAFASGSKK